MRPSRTLYTAPLLVSAALVARVATADDGGTTTASESIDAPAESPNPTRFSYEKVCKGCAATPAAARLNNAEGVNFDDCEKNLRLDFPLVTSGFNSGDDAHIEVWAGTVDCTQDNNRGAGQPCWQVAAPIPSRPPASLTVSVYARDILRYEEIPVSGEARPYDPTFNYSDGGISACFVQSSDAEVDLYLYFMPVNGSGEVGAAYRYPIRADTVGPPPPTASLVPGDTLVTMSWTPLASDPDVQGYVVYSDPPASGTTSGGGCGCGSTPGASGTTEDASNPAQDATAAVCIDSAAEAAPQADALESESAAGDGAATPEDGPATPEDGSAMSEGGSLPESGAEMEAGSGVEGGVDAGTPDAGHDAGAKQPGCQPPVNTGGSCVDGFLTGAKLFGGSVTATVPAADGGDASSTTTTVSAGISQIHSEYQAGQTDTSTTSLTLTGFTNGVVCHVVVAAIDGSDNVGPPSSLQCAKPEPVQDYWGSYKGDGGRASGCALESGRPARQGSALLLGALAVAIAWIRRKRR